MIDAYCLALGCMSLVHADPGLLRRPEHAEGVYNPSEQGQLRILQEQLQDTAQEKDVWTTYLEEWTIFKSP